MQATPGSHRDSAGVMPHRRFGLPLDVRAMRFEEPPVLARKGIVALGRLRVGADHGGHLRLHLAVTRGDSLQFGQLFVGVLRKAGERIWLQDHVAHSDSNVSAMYGPVSPKST